MAHLKVCSRWQMVEFASYGKDVDVARESFPYGVAQHLPLEDTDAGWTILTV